MKSKANTEDKSVGKEMNGTATEGPHMGLENGSSSTNGTVDISLQDESILNTDAYLDQLIPDIKRSIKQDSLDSLLTNLEKSILQKETQLETLSFSSSRDVLSSIDTVKQIKKSSNELSQQVILIQKNLAKTGYELTTKKKVAMNYKKVSNKITETIFVLQSCLQILELTNKIMDMISKKNFYNALKLLDDLSNLYSSNELFENFEFTRQISNSIPTLRSMCKDDSINYIKKWLTNSVERSYQHIGESVTNEMAEVIENWIELTNDNRELRKFKVNSAVELSLRPDSNFDPMDEIDLKPLYDGILVYETLGEEEQLTSEYHSEMLNKRDRLMKDLMKNEPMATAPTKGYHRKNSIPTSTFKSLDELNNFLHMVLGLLISDHLINVKSGNKLRTETNLKDLYNSLTSKIYPTLNSFLNNKVFTLEELERFRNILGLFVASLDNYGYRVDSYYHVLVSAYKKFTVLQFEDFKKSYQRIVEGDDSLPMNFNTKELYEKICDLAWYKVSASQLRDLRIPAVLPFSSIYPVTCARLRNFVTAHQDFVRRHYSYRPSELDKILVASLDNVLTNVVISYLSTKLDSTIKEEIAQNLINLEFFSNSVKELERIISRNSNNQLYLKSYSNFIQLRKNAESKIFELVDSKVLDLIEFAQWDFTMKGLQSEPSIFIKDIGEFLEMMFNTNFNNLPTSIRQLLLFRSFDLIADHFLSKIRDASLITSEALQNFQLDVDYLESLISSMNEGVKANQEQHQSLSINSTFIELNQVIELLKSQSLQYYKQHQNTKFTRIKAEEVNSLIDKLENVQQERRRKLMAGGLEDDNSDAISIVSTNTVNNSSAATTNGDNQSRFARFKFRKNDRE